MVLATGWLRGYTSLSDYHPGTDEVTDRLQRMGQPSVQSMLQQIGVVPEVENIPPRMDLSSWFSPVEDQGRIGSCTAQTTIGLAEYFQIRAFKQYTNLSKLFLYKTTRSLLGWTGDTGAFMRTAMGALALCGAPPEKYWPYVEQRFDREPSAFAYSLAQNFQATSYYRLDPAGTRPPEILDMARAFIASGMPCMFGFNVYPSIGQASEMNAGSIPFPVRGERITGGHAVIACGYDDDFRILNSGKGAIETIGAFKVRSSWGVNWGDAGYGWIPYQYVLSGLADDFWSLMQQEWVDSGQFGEKA